MGLSFCCCQKISRICQRRLYRLRAHCDQCHYNPTNSHNAFPENTNFVHVQAEYHSDGTPLPVTGVQMWWSRCPARHSVATASSPSHHTQPEYPAHPCLPHRSIHSGRTFYTGNWLLAHCRHGYSRSTADRQRLTSSCCFQRSRLFFVEFVEQVFTTANLE